MAKENLIFVGMPGAGKSTIGVLLAKEINMNFIDVDVYIQSRENRRLQEIIDEDGSEAFKDLEEKYLLEIDVKNHVLSTGGSAIYSTRAIEKLKENGRVVYLYIDIPTLKKRLGNFSTRGVVIRPGQTFEDLFNERCALYKAAADIEIDCRGKSMESIVLEIKKAL